MVLTGIHLSSYGIERMEENPVSHGDWNHRELLALIKEVHAIEGLERIRLGSLEQGSLPENLQRSWQSFPSSASFPSFSPEWL